MARSRTSGQGRPKGTPNRLTGDIKAMIVGALSKVGGEAYLVQCARRNPVAFLGLVGKVLPLQIAGTGEDGKATTLTFEWAAATASPHEHDNGADVGAATDDTLH